MRQSLLLIVASFASATAVAGPVRSYLVTDANPTPLVVDSSPDGFYVNNGLLYFAARRSDVGRELFATDGTSATATLVADLAPSSASSNPFVLGRAGSRLIVSTKALDPETGRDRHTVVAFDLQTGQREPLAEFAPLDNFFTWRIDRVAELGQRVVFSDLTDGTLWSTDGTAAGTGLLFTPTTPDASVSGNVCTFGDRFVFLGRRAAGLEVWTSDGTAAGTRSVTPIAESGMTIDAARVGDDCHFLVQRSSVRAVWTSDGTAAGTRLAASFDESVGNSLAALGNGAYLLGSGQGRRLLYRVGQVQPAVDVSGAWSSEMAVAGDRIAFVRGESVGVPAPIVVTVTDGTPAGTATVTLDGVALELANASTRLAGAGGRFYLRNGAALYAIDPATATAQSLGARPMLDSWEFASLGTLAIGAATDGAGKELWRSDGTAAGTRALPDVAAPTGNVAGLAAFGDGVAFTTRAADGSLRAYRTDAGFGATALLWNSLASTALVASADGRALTFACRTTGADDNLCGLRDSDLQAGLLWVGGAGPEPWLQRIGSAGNVVLSLYRDRLWRSDGTMPGTFELAPGVEVDNARATSAALPGGIVVFSACVGPNGLDCGLYRSDASVAGTQRLIGLAGDLTRAFAPLGNDRLLFGTDTGALWVTDGTAAGTQRIAVDVGSTYGMASTGTRVHLQTRRIEPPSLDYVVSDGTAAGTRIVTPPAGYYAGTEPPVALDADTVVFPCYGADIGYELCRVDADGNGWTVAADIAPGALSSGPQLIAQTGHAAYFSADDGAHGAELWRVESLVDAIYADGFD